MTPLTHAEDDINEPSHRNHAGVLDEVTSVDDECRTVKDHRYGWLVKIRMSMVTLVGY